MSSNTSIARYLGAAFLFQAISSLITGVFMLEPLVVEDDIIQTMINISENAVQVRADIIGWVLTAMGIIALGALLYLSLKAVNKPVALIAFGLYIAEATILAVSRIATFGLLHISQESTAAGHPDYFQALGRFYYEVQAFGNTLHVLFFAVGATLFYYLLVKSRLIPNPLALFGLTAASLAVIGMFVTMLGQDVPIILFIPNLPFELGVGLWLVAKGFKPSATALQPGLSS